MSDNTFYNQLQQGLLKMFEDVDTQNQSTSVLEKLGVILGSNIGCIRKENQDRTLFLRAVYRSTQKANFVAAVLCDGMGGMIQGGECASLATSVFVSSLLSLQESDLSLRLKTSVQDANDAVFKKYHGEGGSTLVALVCDQFNNWLIASVGDSRIYKTKLGFEPELLTVDDTVERQLDLLGKSINISSEFSRGLTQFIGVGESIEVHLQSLNPKNDEVFILTSDGAHDLSSDGKVFSSVVINSRSSQELVSRLLNISEWLGGRDNATVAIIPTTHDFNLQRDGNQMGYLEVWSPSEKNNFINLSPESSLMVKNGYEKKTEQPKNQPNKRKGKATPNSASKSDTENGLSRNDKQLIQIDIVESSSL
jgi:PPM family protein phosphatase